MPNNPKVSVLMPVYNTAESYLRPAIESILNQTFTDFEFLIIDDKSTNNAPDVIAEYAKSDKRIRVIKGNHNGIGAVRNLALKQAQGKYVAWLDSDDLSLPQRLEKQVTFLEDNTDVSICCTGFKILPTGEIGIIPQKVSILYLYKKTHICQSTVMMRLEDIKKFDLWYNENLIPEDYDLWARAIRKVKISSLPDVLVHYHTVEGSLSHRKKKEISGTETKIKQELLDFVTTDKKLQNKIQELLYLNKLSFLQKIFSIRSRFGSDGSKQKIIIFLGHFFFLPARVKRKNCHIVKIMGGLGNQMFQYAFGQNFDDVCYDISEYQTNKYRSFDLDLYAINKSYATSEQTQYYKKKSVLPRFIRHWFHLPKCKDVTIERQINKYYSNFLKCKNAYFEGYFQTEKYFKHLRKRLLHDFTLQIPFDSKNFQLLENIQKTNSVAIHIRRGDYLSPAVSLALLDVDYYRKAIDYIASRVENPHFYIFSNDFDWVRENIKSGYAQTIVDINDESHGYFDLELMRQCKHNIIANSSFSWWAAWLNENSDKIVIAPSVWFKPTAKECFDDMIPDEWIKM